MEKKRTGLGYRMALEAMAVDPALIKVVLAQLDGFREVVKRSRTEPPSVPPRKG